MKIAIDARWIFNEISGIGSYTVNLIRTLVQQDSDNTYLLIFDDIEKRKALVRSVSTDREECIETAVLPYGLFSLRNQLLLPGFLRARRVDVYHAPNYMIPLFGISCPCVVTIHDIIPLRHPEWTPRAKKTKFFGIYKRIMKRVSKKADAILTDSFFSRDDLLDFFRLILKKYFACIRGLRKNSYKILFLARVLLRKSTGIPVHLFFM